MNDTWTKNTKISQGIKFNLTFIWRWLSMSIYWSMNNYNNFVINGWLVNNSRDNICLEGKLNLALTFIWPWQSSSKHWIMRNFSSEYIWLVCYDYLINIWELFITYLPWQGFDIRLSNHVITYRTINTRLFIYPVQPITRCRIFFVIYGNWPRDRDIRHLIKWYYEYHLTYYFLYK